MRYKLEVYCNGTWSEWDPGVTYESAEGAVWAKGILQSGPSWPTLRVVSA
jgi:hypothetical protein